MHLGCDGTQVLIVGQKVTSGWLDSWYNRRVFIVSSG